MSDMTPNTQSVCELCKAGIARNGKAHFRDGEFIGWCKRLCEPVAEPASTGEPQDYCQCGAIGLDSSGKCAVCRKPVPGAESGGFSVIIKCHTQEALDKLHDPEKLRMLIGASIDALILQEEIDYTLEVRRDYK